MEKYVEAKIEILQFPNADIVTASHGEGEDTFKVGDENSHF